MRRLRFCQSRKLYDLGFSLYGTEGTVKFLAQNDIPMNLVRKVQEGSPNILDMIRALDVHLLINTPGDKNARADHLQIMRASIDYSIPYITTIFGPRIGSTPGSLENGRRTSLTAT